MFWKDVKDYLYMVSTFAIVMLGIFIIRVVVGFLGFEISGLAWRITLQIVVVIFIFNSCYKLLYPLLLIIKGKYDEAIIRLDKLLKSFKGNTRNQIFFNIANCYHRKGEFDKSNEYLEQINEGEVDKNIRDVYYGLYAQNLLLLEKDFELVENYLKKSSLINKVPEGLPMQSYLELLKEKYQESTDLLQQYFEKKKTKNFIFEFKTILLIDKEFADIQNNFFVGLIYLRTGKLELAKKHLLEASACKYDNYYSKKASELLQK